MRPEPTATSTTLKAVKTVDLRKIFLTVAMLWYW